MITNITQIEQEGTNTPVNVNVVNSSLSATLSPTLIDAFSRMRTSDPFTLADYSHVYGEETELLTKTSGNLSNITFDLKKAKAILTVGSGLGDYTIHQSRMYHHYMPGKSQLTFQSFNFRAPRSGTNKRVGLFDDKNGIFLQQSGDGTLSFVLRNSISGSTYDDIIPQSQWNVDQCDGNGPSAFNVDQTKTQLFYSDYEWLGVGTVRAGFVHEGQIVIAHKFYNSNIKENVYWSNPNLPVRCDIRNYGTPTGSGQMDQICATVISEGGYKEAGVDFSIRSTGYRNIAAGSTMPVIAIRLKTGYQGEPNRSIVRLGSTELYSKDQLCSYEFWRLPSGASLIGGSWVSADDASVVEYNINATGYSTSGGLMFDVGFLTAGGIGVGNTTAGTASIADASAAKRGYISQNIDSNDSNIFAIVFKNFASGPGNTTDVLAGMQWRETR